MSGLALARALGSGDFARGAVQLGGGDFGPALDTFQNTVIANEAESQLLGKLPFQFGVKWAPKAVVVLGIAATAIDIICANF